jgi:hypothetical protein
MHCKRFGRDRAQIHWIATRDRALGQFGGDNLGALRP